MIHYDKDSIVNHEKINEIIKKHSLTEEQINEAIPIFIEIINQKNSDDFISDIKVHSNGIITRILKPSKKKEESLSQNRNHYLKEISLLNKNYNFGKQKNNSTSSTSYFSDINNSRIELTNYLKNNILLKLKNNEFAEGLFLYGKFGVGKTFFFSALANHLLKSNKSIIFINLTDLNNLIKSNFEDGFIEIKKKIENCDFLFIDSLGNEKLSEWFINSIFISILSYRLDNNKTTLFNSNFSPKLLEIEYKKQYSSILSKHKIDVLVNKILNLSKHIIELKN
ncbi:MAG: DnaA ATPase domain-containing protein [Metamycoplasmataceae bacterium]